MSRRLQILGIFLLCLATLTACGNNSETADASNNASSVTAGSGEPSVHNASGKMRIPDAALEPEEDMSAHKVSERTIRITVGQQTFSATLEENETANVFRSQLPLELAMSDLNGNEKYYYADAAFPSAASAVGSVKAGDLMLYGSDCIVLFYESFRTPYSYTKIGAIDNPEGLKDAVGSGSVTVTFQPYNK